MYVYAQNTLGRIIKKRTNINTLCKGKKMHVNYGENWVFFTEKRITRIVCVFVGGLFVGMYGRLNIYLRTRPKSLISSRFNGYFATKRVRATMNKFKINVFTDLKVFGWSFEICNSRNCFEEKAGRTFYMLSVFAHVF